MCLYCVLCFREAPLYNLCLCLLVPPSLLWQTMQINNNNNNSSHYLYCILDTVYYLYVSAMNPVIGDIFLYLRCNANGIRQNIAKSPIAYCQQKEQCTYVVTHDSCFKTLELHRPGEAVTKYWPFLNLWLTTEKYIATVILISMSIYCLVLAISLKAWNYSCSSVVGNYGIESQVITQKAKSVQNAFPKRTYK